MRGEPIPPEPPVVGRVRTDVEEYLKEQQEAQEALKEVERTKLEDE
jgi:hypothetical protein